MDTLPLVSFVTFDSRYVLAPPAPEFARQKFSRKPCLELFGPVGSVRPTGQLFLSKPLTILPLLV